VTLEQAEAVLAAVNDRYAAHLVGAHELDRPTLIENWGWFDSGPIRWAIVWEPGPFEWAHRASMGGFDEEAAGLFADQVGREQARAMAKRGAFTEDPLPVPPGTYLETLTGWAVGVYEA
jgi:hypothetical protein